MSMKKIFWVLMIGAVVTACGEGKSDADKEKAKIQEANGKLETADGKMIQIFKGGVFKMNQMQIPSSYFPHGTIELSGAQILNQVYQGLVKFNQEDLTVINCLAESRDMDSSATVFTYKLRKGVKFHDDACFDGNKGREITANDFKYCLEMLCKPSAETKVKDNKLFPLVENKIKGAKEFYDSYASGSPLEGVEGIQVLDDYTLQITLNEPFASFDDVLATPLGYVFPKEAVEKYGEDFKRKMIGTGPFRQKNEITDRAIFLERNPNYWEKDEHGNQLPYLDMVKVTFVSQKKSEFEKFNTGGLDMVWKIPVDEIQNVLGNFNDAKHNTDYELDSKSSLSLQYYGFNHTKGVFKDKNVRLAFNYAIDRESLVEKTLQGSGSAAVYGIVPPMPGYPHEKVNGYTLDVEKAKSLLAEAGYPNGKGFPDVTLYYNSEDNANSLVASAIQNELKENLGVTIKLVKNKMSQHLPIFESGKADFWRIAWVADYPEPENFIYLFLSQHINEGGGFFNSGKYSNPEYDALYKKAVGTVDKDERMDLYVQADQILIDDAVIMPLYYDNYIRLTQRKVQNFPQNEMEYRDLTRVFFDKTKIK